MRLKRLYDAIEAGSLDPANPLSASASPALPRYGIRHAPMPKGPRPC